MPSSDTFVAPFIFYSPPSALVVLPGTGPTTGGATVTIIGSGFLAGASVTFDGTPATGPIIGGIGYSWLPVTDNTIICQTPSHAAGAVDVVVSNPVNIYTGATDTSTITGGYTYAVVAPTVTGIMGSVGSTGGSEAVVITGTGFVATPTVKFGGTSGTTVVFIDTNTITCITPAHAAGVVDITVTNPDAQIGILYNGFTYGTGVGYPDADADGWWWSTEGLAGGTQLALAPGVPKHPRVWAKIVSFATAGSAPYGGFPAASAVFRNHIIYAGDDYTVNTTQPTIRIFDGLSDRLMTSIPSTSTGVVSKAIISMLLNNGIIYLTTLDSGTTSADFSGRVFAFEPLGQTLTQLGAPFTAGEVPYALEWHMDRLWVGTNAGDATKGAVYFIRPNIDTAWTTDYTLSTSTVGGATSLQSYNGKLYVGTDNVNAAFAKILVRDTAGAYTTSLTATGGAAKVNNAFLSMINFGTNLYATYWNPDTTKIAKVYKYDGTSWTDVHDGATLNLRPYILSFLANQYLYIAGGSTGYRASLIRSSDGTTWVDLSPYLSGPITETALPIYGVVGL